MYPYSSYIYDSYIIPIDYSATVYETKDAVFYDFEDEYLVISPPSLPLHNSHEISESQTIKLALIQKFVFDF